MQLLTRKILDKSFSFAGLFTIVLMISSLLIILCPIFYKGIQAYVFRGTIEYRRLMYEKYHRGNKQIVDNEIKHLKEFKDIIIKKIQVFESEIQNKERAIRFQYRKKLRILKKNLEELLGPLNDSHKAVLWRDQYGETRWEKAKEKLNKVLFKSYWDYSNPSKMGVLKYNSRADDFKGTSLESLFLFIKLNLNKILLPKWTFYPEFLTDGSNDAHFFGGIGPEVLGTIYLTLGAMFIAVPLGIVAAVYLCEYARKGIVLSILRSFINTLAGVPSIVFGLFGLAFFINTIKLSESKSVIAGAATLSLLILPTIIRASEEAIKAVPDSYKEASIGLGATKWNTIKSVILPNALPGILTGIIISMGRAAGETAPIIFTAAVSVGNPLKLIEIFKESTPALSWNIFNLSTEHEAVNEIRHVQYGMVMTLIVIVLSLNLITLFIRAKISKNLKG